MSDNLICYTFLHLGHNHESLYPQSVRQAHPKKVPETPKKMCRSDDKKKTKPNRLSSECRRAPKKEFLKAFSDSCEL